MIPENKIAAPAGKADSPDPVSAADSTLDMAQYADAAVLAAQIEAQIRVRKAELRRLEKALGALVKVPLKSSNQRRPEWSPKPGTVYGRAFDLFGEGVQLTMAEIVAALAPDDVTAVPYGSICAALSTLRRGGWLVKDGDYWRWPDASEP
ncbi:hypothetical protein [Acidocella sp.]|uniref:hypothetical protein n=1 Tax=Acidocella sp. TaxID=50710 RepID=UPI003CFD6FF2